MANGKAIMAFFTVAVLAVAAVCVVVVQNNNQIQNADDVSENDAFMIDSDFPPYELGVFGTYEAMWGATHQKADNIELWAKAKVTNDPNPDKNGEWIVYKFMNSLVFCHPSSNNSTSNELIIVDDGITMYGPYTNYEKMVEDTTSKGAQPGSLALIVRNGESNGIWEYITPLFGKPVWVHIQYINGLSDNVIITNANDGKIVYEAGDLEESEVNGIQTKSEPSLLDDSDMKKGTSSVDDATAISVSEQFCPTDEEVSAPSSESSSDGDGTLSDECD